MRTAERGALKGAKFARIGQTLTIEIEPIRAWIRRFLEGNDPNRFWVAWLLVLRMPKRTELEHAEQTLRDASPILSMMGTTIVSDDMIDETVSAEDATRRRARSIAYVVFQAHVRATLACAADDFGIKPSMAAEALASTGRFDATSRALLQRVLEAMERGDWVTVVYLGAPLFERSYAGWRTRLG